MRSLRLLFLATLAGMALLVVAAAQANHPPGSPSKVTICHKPGTPAEKTLTLPHKAAEQHVAVHGDTWGECSPPEPAACDGASDFCIDGDGIASAGTGLPGAAEVTVGTVLASFPVTGAGPFSGLDSFDNDGSGTWSTGDDLHSEDPNTCPGAFRNAIHDLGADCKVLDLDGSLTTGQAVTCDVEFRIEFVAGACDDRIRYQDVNSDGVWQSGEDLVLDVNANGIFD